MASKPTWYLAYGSNMSQASMAKRSVQPLRCATVEATSHYLTFDIFGIPYSEPSYASVEAFPDQGCSSGVELVWGTRRFAVPPVCGVAYLLTPDDFHRLLVTEGSGVVYEVVSVQARVLDSGLDSGETIDAVTLKAKHPLRPNGAPSARYLDLFIGGAKGNGLPQTYVDYLESLPRYQKAARTTAGALIFEYTWRPFLKRVVRLTTWNVDSEGNCPAWVAFTCVFLYELMWKYHDCIHRHIWGSGDGGKLEFIHV
ncbi:hypothetical protein SLS56_008710 [Neofusicoccum ribis]|uniref:gamma-glutamylcyclotransferase n=1 Tax=Neofusicoccum ribis TaxID=45134 RepID=A0ABR3SJD8_9PEZI